MSERAVQVALATLMAAARQGPSNNRRTATKDGLACTIVHVGRGCDMPALIGPRFTIWMPGRQVVFHLASVRLTLVGIHDAEPRVTLTYRPRAAVDVQTEGSVA
jgi:hypothetical protein